MSIVTTLFASLISFSAGVVIGASEESKARMVIEDWIEASKTSGNDVKHLIVEAIDSLEGVDSDELKANVSKIISILKEKLEELQEKVDNE